LKNATNILEHRCGAGGAGSYL